MSSQLQQLITPAFLASEARLLRGPATKPQKVLLVEGGSDYKVLQPILNLKAHILPGDGRQNVLDTLKHPDVQGSIGWLRAIVDADFDRVTNTPPSPQVLLTDSHDIDCDLFRSESLHKLVINFCSDPKCTALYKDSLKKDPAKIVNAIRNEVLGQALVIGVLRLESVRNKYGIGLQNIDYSRVTKPQTITVDYAALARYGHARSNNPTLNQSGIEKLLQKYNWRGIADPWQVCQGHDLAGLLALGLRKRWSGQNYDADWVITILRIGFDAAWFWNSNLGKQVQQFL